MHQAIYKWRLSLINWRLLDYHRFTNGFHDAADIVATAIASRAMKTAMDM